MLKTLAFLLFVAVGSLAQEIAKRKCGEYAAIARANGESAPQCRSLGDGRTGVKIEPGDFPATAALGYETKDKAIKYLCDATLISEDTLVTAGHCLQQHSYGDPKWARLGVTHSTLGVEVAIKEAVRHPQYKPGHDLGLVKLQQPVNSSVAVPACLDTEGVGDGTRGVGVGRPVGSAYIQLGKECPVKAALEVKPGEQCTAVYSKQNISTEATLCTKDPAGGPGDCMSGPLYVSRQPCVHTVVGVSSFGQICASGNSDHKPSVYTRISYYVPWIESVIWAA